MIESNKIYLAYSYGVIMSAVIVIYFYFTDFVIKRKKLKKNDR